MLAAALTLGLAICAALGAPVADASRSARQPLHLVVIGDSIAYGQNDCNHCLTFGDLYATAASRRLGVRVIARNLSQHDDLTTPRLLKELKSDYNLERAVASADMILLSIGFNDTPWNALDDSCDANHGWPDGNKNADWTIYTGTCLTVETARYRRNLTAVYKRIRQLRAGKKTLIRQATQYDDIVHATVPPPLPPATAWSPSVAVVTAYVKIACTTALAEGALCGNVFYAFNGPKGTRSPGVGTHGLLSPADGTHPNAAGHRLIAHVLERLGYAPLH